MTAEDILYDDDIGEEADIVEWYETRPVTVSTACAAGAVLGAFALGALTAIATLTLLDRLEE